MVNTRSERFPLMDSLRAFAALSVLAFHAAFFAGMYDSDSPLRPYLAQPVAGVTVFFVISGFLLYRPVRRRAAGRGARPRHAGLRAGGASCGSCPPTGWRSR